MKEKEQVSIILKATDIVLYISFDWFSWSYWLAIDIL